MGIIKEYLSIQKDIIRSWFYIYKYVSLRLDLQNKNLVKLSVERDRNKIPI